ncbi:MAG: IPExxxVDY family protein [Tenacibaculum sp.]|nr:IPExxxVDY family protein [Tenacibaculum sp.]
MQVYSIDINELSDDNFTLIGIHSTLKDYQLAYLLNRELHTLFKRDFNNNLSFPLYEYYNDKLDCDYFLIANVIKSKSKSLGLFNENEIITYLIPEKKKIDYFIKLEGNIKDNYLIETLHKINQIPQIITSYTVDLNTLKSKKKLIF